jgi:1-acyl-sn-glycerol-3-phosphate acyltransferase
MMHKVLIVAPPSSLADLLVEVLAASPRVMGCRLLPAPPRQRQDGEDRYAGNALAEAAGNVMVYRPPLVRRSGQPDLADAAALLRACAVHRPRRLILLSSAAVVEPSHHHPGHAGEDAILPRAANPIARSWAELEALAGSVLAVAGTPAPGAANGPGSQEPAAAGSPGSMARGSATHEAYSESTLRASGLLEAPGPYPAPSGTQETGPFPAPRLIVLRPAAVCAPDGEDFLCALLRARVAVVPAGYDPSVQLLAGADLAAAVRRATEEGDEGVEGEADGGSKVLAPGRNGGAEVYYVAPAGVVPVRAALRLAGGVRLAVPFALQRLLRALPARLGWVAPIEQVAYLRHTSTVSGRKIRDELGFSPRQGSVEALLDALPPGRRSRRPAGATGVPPPAAAPATRPGEVGGAPARPAVSAVSAVPALPAVPELPPIAAFDDYGMSKPYIAAYGRTLFHFLHRYYWRIEVAGLEHVPRAGRAVLVGVHRGFMPWDGVMALHTLVRSTGRYPRFLIHPTLVKFPYLANYMTKLGGLFACQENADWVLGQDELLGMFPEGIQGAFTMYRDAYRLGKFGRDEYVKMALRNRAPLVPFVTAGSAEIYPILGKLEWRWFRRFMEWPFLPLCPNFPLPGLPLPTKWHTRFLAPLPIERSYGPEAADDAAAVREISAEVRARIQDALDSMRRRRRSIFVGSIFDDEDDAGEAAGRESAEAGPPRRRQAL